MPLTSRRYQEIMKQVNSGTFGPSSKEIQAKFKRGGNKKKKRPATPKVVKTAMV